MSITQIALGVVKAKVLASGIVGKIVAGILLLFALIALLVILLFSNIVRDANPSATIPIQNPVYWGPIAIICINSIVVLAGGMNLPGAIVSILLSVAPLVISIFVPIPVPNLIYVVAIILIDIALIVCIKRLIDDEDASGFPIIDFLVSSVLSYFIMRHFGEGAFNMPSRIFLSLGIASILIILGRGKLGFFGLIVSAVLSAGAVFCLMYFTSWI